MAVIIDEHKIKILSYWFLLFSFLCVGFNIYALENISQCEGTAVVVNYDTIKDLELVCDAVKDVNKVAKKIGLSEGLDVSVSIIDRLTIGYIGTPIALFEPANKKIQVLSMAGYKKSLLNYVIFDQKIDTELFKSIIIHELAHALAWNNMKTRRLNRGLHEYFAYVIQFALLDNIHRDKIIASTDVKAYTDLSEITEVYYYLSPKIFAIKSYKSYLHFANSKDGWAHLSSIFDK